MSNILTEISIEEELSLFAFPEEAIPCQCLETGDATLGGHGLHFEYYLSLWRRIKPQRKYVSYEPGAPTKDPYDDCPYPARYRATFKGHYPGLGKLVPSSYTLCEICMEHWKNTKQCVNFETL